jgi:transposase
MSELFWLSERQWAAIQPRLPCLGGRPRVDDRRVISGVLHRFREGLRWRAVPEAYGPRTTLFNRFNRWSQKGIWQDLLAALAACDDPPGVAMVDSTAVRAHRSAAGAKGGRTGKRSAARAVDRRPKSTPSPMVRGAFTR